MVHVGAAASDCGSAVRGWVGRRACGGLRFALPDNGGRNSSVGRGATPEVLQRYDQWESDVYKAYLRSHGNEDD